MAKRENVAKQCELANAANAPEEAKPRAVWERPVIRRLAAGDASTGINLGPEIIVLLS